MLDNLVNLATYYRPRTFSEIKGQGIAVSVVKTIASADGIACRSLFLKGSYGSGKCVLPSTRVVTSRGYEKIGTLLNVNEGFSDFKTDVLSRNGIKKSDKFFKQSSVKVNLLGLVNGETVNGTDKHRVYSWNGKTAELHSLLCMS